MLEKLAAIADFADQNGQYGVANDATKIIKEAQLWDAMRTLFDPEHTPGVDSSTSWLERLSKGWGRGKMDRNLGLVLAIMTERTKLNQKIEKMTAPIKGFQVEVTSYYDRLRDGRITSSNLRQESRVLQSALKEALGLISGRELKQTLKLRERLEKQQQIAAEKIKGLDDETKGNLMAVLKGESLPGIGAPGTRAPAGDGGVDAMKRWLKNQPIPNLSMHEGAETVPGQYSFRKFRALYGYNPKAIVDYFINNSQAQSEAFERYPDAFNEMFRHAQQLQIYDNEMLKGVHRSQKGRGKVPGTVEPTTPAAAAAKKVIEQANKATGESDFSMPDVNEPNENKAPAKSGPNKDFAMPDVNEPSAAAKKLEPLDIKDLTSIPLDIKDRTERDKELASTSRKALKKERKSRQDKKKEEPRAAQPAPVTLPEEVTKREVEKEGGTFADDTLSLAASASQRTERQITRLARSRQLRKLAGSFSFDVDPSVMVEDELNKLTNEMPEDKYLEFAQEEEDAKEPLYVDMFDANPEGRETFDEGMDYDPAQTGVEMYHGPDIDDEHLWNKPLHRAQPVSGNSLLSKMEQYGRLWREAPDDEARALIQAQLDKLQAEYDLVKDKEVLTRKRHEQEAEMKLPDGWADDGEV